MQYWPYSWLSPHSLILLASCWAFFFSRQALKTERNRAASFSGTRNAVQVFLFSTRPCYRICWFTLRAAGERWEEDVLPNCEGDWLETSLIPSLLQKPFDTIWSEASALVSEYLGLKNGGREWINQCTLNINVSPGDLSLQFAEISLFLPLWVSKMKLEGTKHLQAAGVGQNPSVFICCMLKCCSFPFCATNPLTSERMWTAAQQRGCS